MAVVGDKKRVVKNASKIKGAHINKVLGGGLDLAKVLRMGAPRPQRRKTIMASASANKWAGKSSKEFITAIETREEQIRNLQNKILRVEEMLSMEKKKVERLDLQNESLVKKADDALADKKQAESKAHELKTSISDLESKLEVALTKPQDSGDLQLRLDKLNEKLEERERMLDQKESTIATLKSMSTGLEAETRDLRQEANNLRAELRAEQKMSTDLELAKQCSGVESLKRDLEVTKQTCNQQEKLIKDQLRTIDELKEASTCLKDSRDSLSASVVRLTERVVELEEALPPTPKGPEVRGSNPFANPLSSAFGGGDADLVSQVKELKVRSRNLERKNKSLSRELDATMDKCEERDMKIDELEQTIAELKSSSTPASSSTEQEKSSAELERQLKMAELNNTGLYGALKELEARLADADIRVQKAMTLQEEQRKAYEDAQEAKEATYKSQIAEKDKELEELGSKLRVLSEDIKRKGEELRVAKTLAKESEMKAEMADARVVDLQQTIKKLREASGAQDAALENLEAALEKAHEKQQRLASETARSEFNLEKVTSERDKALDEQKRLKHDLEKAQAQGEAASDRALQASKDAEKATETHPAEDVDERCLHLSKQLESSEKRLGEQEAVIKDQESVIAELRSESAALDRARKGLEVDLQKAKDASAELKLVRNEIISLKIEKEALSQKVNTLGDDLDEAKRELHHSRLSSLQHDNSGVGNLHGSDSKLSTASAETPGKPKKKSRNRGLGAALMSRIKFFEGRTY